MQAAATAEMRLRLKNTKNSGKKRGKTMLSEADYQKQKAQNRAWAEHFVETIQNSADPTVKYRDSRPITDIKDMLESSCREFAENTAFLVKDKKGGEYRPIKYKEALADVNGLGTALIAGGLKGKRISVIGENSYQCKDDIDNAHDDGLHHSSAFGTGIFEYSRRIIEHGVDADGLLEDRKQNTDNNHRRTVGEQLLCLFLRSGFYFGKNLLCFCGSIHFFENGISLLILINHHQITGSFGYEEE